MQKSSASGVINRFVMNYEIKPRKTAHELKSKEKSIGKDISVAQE